MKKLKKLWIIFLVILQVGLPAFSSLLIATETVYATESKISETSEKTKETETTDDATASSTSSSAKPAADKETTSSSVEKSVTDETTQEESKKSKASSTTSESTEPQESIVTSDLTRAGQYTFNANIQAESDNGIIDLPFRNDSDTEKAIANWKVLRNVGYNLQVVIDGYPSGIAASSRQVKIKIPRGLIVPVTDLESIKANPNVKNYTIEDKTHVVVNQIGYNFGETTYMDNVNGTNTHSTKYVTGSTIVFDLEPDRRAEGFSFRVLPNFEDGTENSPNFWTGVSGDSLTRHQPIIVDFIEDNTVVNKKVLDDIVIPSVVSHSVVTGNPSVSGSTAPGTQTLDKVMNIYIQPRLRNDTENASSNAFYMGNTTYKAYVPYKNEKLANGKYLSAKLETGEMDAWIARITGDKSQIIDYSFEEQPDGRIIVTYYFLDDQKEYLIQSPNLQMYYSYPSEEDENGNKFAPNDVIVYTQNNLGQTFHNYRYNSDGTVTMEESLVRPLTDSTAKITITDENEFKLEWLARPGNVDNPTYSTIALKDSDAAVLLDYALITNKSPAKGDTRVEYKIDTGNNWNYGVTTIQFWTVDSTFGGGVEASREHTYTFDFVLQRKGSEPGEDILKGTYSLTPKDEYAGVKINRDNGSKQNLIGYSAVEERYFYYVNREMLARGVDSNDLPNGFDINDYYIKELSYDLYLSAREGQNYVSGINNRPKESGGQLYGHTFGNAGDTGLNSFSITPKNGAGKALQESHTTKLIAKSTTHDLTTFLRNTMSVKNEAGTKMTTSDQRVSVGEKVSVSASALACFYPYGLLSYSPDPVFIIRTPIDLDLDTDSIKLKQEQEGAVVDLNYAIEELQEPLSDGSKIYYVTPTNSNGIGFYNENRNEIGEAITIDYKMKVNIAARAQPIKYKELLFVADKNFKNGTGGSYSGYAQADEWGIANSANGQVAFYYPNANAQLMTTNVAHMFNTNQPVLDFDLGSSLDLEADVNNEKTGGVIDDEARDFKANFSMSNTKQSGYVGEDGMFIFYIPIPKEGNALPEWIKGDRKHEFSLSLTGPVDPVTSMGVDYEVAYTTEKDLRFDNGEANFNGSATYAAYVPYDDVKNNLEAVTMVKVIARRGNGNEHIIPFGEKMTAEIPLTYSSSNSSGASFEERAGQTTAWTPYVVQRYTLGSATNEFKTLAPESSVRILYREKFEREIWAYNTDNYPSGEHEGIPMDKKIDIDLPNFQKVFDLQINQLQLTDIVNMMLKGTGEFNSPDESVSFGNQNFGFDVGLKNGTTDVTKDLFNAHPEGNNQVIGLGETSSAGNRLTYKIYNGPNITETASSRSITIKYNSVVNGKITDDIEFEVTLIIRRRASIIDAVTALVAGKEYRTFTNAEKNKITLQDGAFTAQFAYNTEYLKAHLPNITVKNKIYLEFGSIGLPPGDTVLMKVQSSDSNGNVKPEYYYYKNPDDETLPKKQIELTNFTKMGTDEKLSIDDISRHIDDADLLSYLFIFDFANSKNAEIVENDTISLKSDIPSWDNNDGPKFKIDPLREITNSTNPDLVFPREYEQRQPIDISGKLTLSALKPESLTAGLVDAYNKDKYLSLGISLYENGQKKSWPQGSMIQVGDKLITPVNIQGDLQFVYPVGEIKNDSVELNYDFKVLTDLEPLAAGNYQIRVEAFRDLSQSHPLGGDLIDEAVGKLDIRITAPTNGIRISSDIKKRLVYSRTSGQSANITIDTEGISKVTTTLEKKIGVGYEAVSDTGSVLTTDLFSLIQISQDGSNSWTVTFKNSIAEDDNGEYRIVFKGYDDKDELLYETNWTFIVCNPPN